MEQVQIKVEVDYDGYFERLTRQILTEANNPHIKSAIVVAQPYLPYAVDINPLKDDKNCLHFRWYSGLRTGFGSLPYSEVVNDLKNWVPSEDEDHDEQSK